MHLGGGWNAYVRLAAPGDIDGDGRADLLAVDSRGDLYRYLADGTGRFTPRVKIGNGWNTYSGLF
ncbi:VCBS repeat-containing protein [Streptomyces albulus]|nr:VCBS repeat-containing protein [Streptomyces noursei]